MIQDIVEITGLTDDDMLSLKMRKMQISLDFFMMRINKNC